MQTARNINGVSFNGSADITVTAAAGTLSGSTLASGVTASSLTSVGTLTGLAVAANSSTFTDTVSVSTTNKVLRVVNGGQDIHFNANLGSGSYNVLTGTQDAGIIFSNGTQGQGNLVIAPWHTSAIGIRIIGSTGQVSIPGFLSINANNNATAIVNAGPNGFGNIGASGAAFNTVYAKASSAQYADLAEIYVGDKHYVPGTVVVFGGTQEVTVSTTSHDPSVAGVVSTNPAYLMNDSVDGVAVALQGRVPCRVLGPVNKGDRVVSSDILGVAQRLDPAYYQPGCIIGKSLESVPDGEIATIEVVVGRN